MVAVICGVSYAVEEAHDKLVVLSKDEKTREIVNNLLDMSYSVDHSADERIKSIVEQLVLAVKTSRNSNEGSTKELKATVLELQQELQAKDIQISTISSELSYQLRAAESSAKQLSVELEGAKMEVHNLAKQVDMLHNENKALETQVNELKNMESVASEQHGRIKELTDELSRKDQEIEGLMEALDEEEKEVEADWAEHHHPCGIVGRRQGCHVPPKNLLLDHFAMWGRTNGSGHMGRPMCLWSTSIAAIGRAHLVAPCLSPM
uniref:Uncharacterized protein n=1 Tax=Setaria viridis TaxID=4556 RepID=A0A4U6VPS3_SETVI|nr:hypothetical protein SEVIR_2G036600v2 [Setaria viridis]